jgi:hypothetical protein
MPFNDDDLHVDDDSEWRPVFGVHTPESEVLELAAIEANAAYEATLAMLARDGVTLTEAARGQLAAFTRTQTRAAVLSVYARLKREADA